MKVVDDPQERRNFHRVLHDARATVFAPGQDWPCQLHDVSLKGCLLEARGDWQLEPGQVYRISIWLARDVEIAMDARPVYQNGRYAGFQCVNIDLDSATALRRLVELNLGDPALLQRDIQALLRGV